MMVWSDFVGYSTGVLGFDPEKNNHKLNFFLQAHTIILNNISKLPEFPTLASSFKKYIQNGRHPLEPNLVLPIFQYWRLIETWFWWLYPYFLGQGIQ